jgi:hypothetical protein
MQSMAPVFLSLGISVDAQLLSHTDCRQKSDLCFRIAVRNSVVRMRIPHAERQLQ